MLLPAAITADVFLEKYWQKRPLRLPQSLPLTLPTLQADELAWLATLEDVESRLVFTEQDETATRYRVEQGPFDETLLQNLPDSDWTLLVQDVDKHLPDFKAWESLVPFIPKWRIDDLMISFAAPGGSVGPHKDHYDVFLCQTEGKRHWRTSDDHTLPADESCSSLSLLQPFQASDDHHCEPGDVLYLPPQIPHWGVAENACMTYSLGMRAPNRAELSATAERLFPDKTQSTIVNIGTDDHYYDKALRSAEIDGWRISREAVQRLRTQSLVDAHFDTQDMATILGCTVTDPKAWLDPEPPEDAEAQEIVRSILGRREVDIRLALHGMTRFAWYREGQSSLIFVNGAVRVIDDSAIAALLNIFSTGSAGLSELQSLVSLPDGADLLQWLLLRAAFEHPNGSE